MSAEIILHHYDTSPFSEKARLLLGLHGFSWRSVIQPTIMPKPDLVPLTGGYRRAPVMQIGADIYCDSQAIMAEIRRRAGLDPAAEGLGWAVNLWADRVFFQPSVAVIFGELGGSVPKAFIEDREKLMGRPFDIEAMKAAAAPMGAQWRSQAAWIDAALADGRRFLTGETAAIADMAAYMNIWFVVSFTPHLAAPLMAGLDRLEAWRGRVQAIGHGSREEMTPGEALAVARASSPAEPPAHDPSDGSGLEPGAEVLVAADDYGRDPIAGLLVAATAREIVIAREEKDLGRLNVHFPRAGYLVTAKA
jgi:glutathione S-transferase